MINWVLQKNLTKPEILARMRSVLSGEGESFTEIEIVPFSTELPSLKHPLAFNIPYGSTTFMLNAYKHEDYKKGIFYDPALFNMANYVAQWGEHLLNCNGQLLELGQLSTIESQDDQQWFVRPNHDGKEFDGRVDKFSQLKQWSNQVIDLDLPDFNQHTEIWISPPIEIEKEWRIFIVNDQIISTSRYLVNGELSESDTDIPDLLIEFIQKRISEYRLHDVYVMDVALIKSGFKIIECNCFNGTGFYQHDIEGIVKAVNAYLKSTVSN